MITDVQPNELADALKRGERLIDVRTPAEFREQHVRGAINKPLERLRPEEFARHRGPLLVICQSGGRSTMACDKLAAAGVTDLKNVAGGTLACVEAGLPTRRGRKAVSLERQVRIAAGSLVVLGTTLGVLVHPGWLGLSGFVGAGLVFAGVSDTCAMGMLLARMPWNQVKEAPLPEGTACPIRPPAKSG